MMHNDSGVIRQAELDDVPAVFDIFQHSDHFAKTGSRQDGISLIDVMDWLESATDKRPMLVFENEGNVVAWCSIEAFYGLPAFESACEISLYVMPNWQGKGIGTQFYRYLEAHRNTFGFTHLIAYIYSSNLNSQNFFTKLGFEQWGRLPNIAQNASITEDVNLLGRAF
ncbi:GNAT family N-acetyltransferase [Marinomonas profundimaris]|uniref:GCN5 family acetyltransferase n=1 Tax=Marinomonas profundimaris TaxID=1208321 RepID=W1RSU8_9GAMM|nr:GNAT family N-acetyltransferase [Marinomonas profundimaris]ETI58709.1 GCN5 family acetyltransferase [Marinomonas profundimaris]